MSGAPPALKDLTPDWLSGLMRSHGFENDITSVVVRPIGTGQVGATYRLELEGWGVPPSLVAKLPSNDPLSKATGKSHLTYLRESRFYMTFAGTRPLPVPRHLFIEFDEESHDFALIMHDLPHHYAGNQLTMPTRQEAFLAVEAAAQIHAAWWGDPMLDTLDWLNGTRAVPPALDIEALYAMFWPAFCDRYGPRVTPEMKRVGEGYLGKLTQWSTLYDGPRCLTHGDFRPDNMLFNRDDADQPVVIVDWQTAGVGSGVSDLAYYMGTALERGQRAELEAALFDHYVTSLKQGGVPHSDLTELWDAYRRAAFAGFLMGVTASMVVVQTARGDDMFLAMCERSAAMVVDHAEVALNSLGA